MKRDKMNSHPYGVYLCLKSKGKLMSKILTLKKFDKQGNEIFGETVNAVFDMVDGQYRVSSVDVAKIFDKVHKDMIKYMKRFSTWEDYVGMGNITHTPLVNEQNGQTYNAYMFNKVAFTYFGLSFTGKVANE